MKSLPIWLTGLVCLALCLVVYLASPRFLGALEKQTYDMLIRTFAVGPQSDRIVIADIDQRSVNKLGQWPWPRYILARLNDALVDAGAAVIAYDVVFAEPDRYSPGNVLQMWADAYGASVSIDGLPANAPAFDDVFATSLRRGSNAVLGCELGILADDEASPAAAAPAARGDLYRGYFYERDGTLKDRKYLIQSHGIDIAVTNLQAAAYTASFSARPDYDNIIRRTPLMFANGPYRIYPALALEALRLYLKAPNFGIFYEHVGVPGIKFVKIKDTVIPTDERGRLVLNFRSHDFPIIPVLDVLNGRYPPGALAGRIVLVGTSLDTLYDIVSTPLDEQVAGVMVHATALDNMLAGDMLWEPRWMNAVNVVGMIIGGLLLIFLVTRVRALLASLTVFVAVCMPLGLSALFLWAFKLVFYPTSLILAWVVVFLAVLVMKYWQKEIVEEFNARLRAVNLNLEKEIVVRKQTEADLVVARNAALSAAKAKSEFLANMSHEIRTPMGGVIGMTELALKTRLTDQQHNYLTKIRISAKALLRIINDILDFSKIEAGKLDIEKTDFSLGTVLEEIADLFSDKAAGQGVELVIDCAGDVPLAVRGDPLRLRQVLVNLIGNALKFTERGLVRLGISLAPDIAEPPPALPEGVDPAQAAPPPPAGDPRATILFAVKDSGIGMSRETLAKLFSSFTQADGSTSRKYGGTGLGLAISKQLVELMGGRIAVDSEVGQGSTFSFRIPFPLQAVPGQGRRRLPPDLQGERALVVDDFTPARDSLAALLAGWGFEVATAAAGAEALALLRAAPGQPCHLLLLDNQIAGEDPLATVAAFKAEPALRAMPVVLITPSFNDAEVKRAETAGACGYHTKPIKPSELWDTVMEIHGLKVATRRDEKTGVALAPGRFRGLRLLLAEDNVINQEVALENLRAAELAADVANNGREAVAGWEKGAYAAILMDVQMPEVDGYEATRRIRAAEKARAAAGAAAPRIPIIAMTAHAMAGDDQACLDAGMDDYLTKPIEPDRLLAVLDRWLPRPAPGAAPLAEPPPEPPAAQAPEPPAAEGPVPALDGVDVAGGLRRVNGNAKLYVSLLKTLRRTHAQTPARIREAVAQGDLAAVRQLAHALKGTAANLSAFLVQEAAKAVEMAAAQDQAAALPPLVAQLENAQAALMEEIQVKLEPPTAPTPAAGAAAGAALAAEWFPLLRRMDELLASGNAQALDLLEELRPAGERLQPADNPFIKLETQIQDFDFDAARATLAAILRQAPAPQEATR